MPIPFLLAGLGVAAGAVGIGGHIDAKKTNEEAQAISTRAQSMYDCEKASMEAAQSRTEKSLERFGYAKKKTLDVSMKHFLNTYDKMKHVQLKESKGLNELSKFAMDEQDAMEIRQLSGIYSSSMKTGAAGAAAGTMVALAASGSMGLVTSSLSLAGTCLTMGEAGMAASFAGTAVSMGAAATPLAAIAAPVVLFTGISASMKADENLEKAKTMYAEAEAAVEKMKVSETLCNAITERSEMFHDVLMELDGMFSECVTLLSKVVTSKEKMKKGEAVVATDFTMEEQKLMMVTRSLAGAVKAVIDTPILSAEGTITEKSQEIYDDMTLSIPQFNRDVELVKSVDYQFYVEEKAERRTSRKKNKCSC